MGIREERREAAREGILAAAHRQLAEGGCASATMAAIAARAGVAAGSLYRHFPSRGELLAVVVGDALHGEQALIDRAIDDAPGPRAALEAWAGTTIRRAQQAPVLTGALLAEPSVPEVDAMRRAARRRREAALARVLSDGAARGAWPGGAVELRATALAGALHAVLVGPGGPAADADALLSFVHRAVGAPAP